MFKNQMQKVAILTPGAAGVTENVYEDTTLGHAVICSRRDLNPLIAYLPPIIKNAKNTVAVQASAAEVARVQCLNLDDETLAKSTRYQVLIEQMETKYESQSNPIGSYAYTTPTVTLGSAALDRANLVSILVGKINAHTTNRVTAYGIQKVAFNTGNGATTPEFGDTVTQATSLYTGTIVKVEITNAATFAGGTAAGYLYLYSASAAMNITQVLTTAGSVVATMVPTAAGVENQDILIIDDGSYFRDGNKGYTSAINGENFTYHTVTEIRAATYERGVGTHMLADVPTFDESGQKMLSGSMEYFSANSMLPVAGHTYSRIEVTCFRPGVADPMTGRPGAEAETTIVIWGDEVDAGNLTNFTTILAAHILLP
jgi:hypothetical protein